MKLKTKWLMMTFVLLTLIFVYVVNINAMNTGFSTKELSYDQENLFVSNIDLSLVDSEPPKSGVLCFDVNEQGLVAIGQVSSQRKEVCIYTSQGEFLYGYSFECSQNFGIEWDGQLINIYFIRSDVIVSVDAKGNIFDAKSIGNTIDNNKYANSLHSTKRTVGDSIYAVRNNMGILNLFTGSYSQVVLINSSGEETVLYDINSMQLAKAIVIMAITSVVITAAVLIIIRQFIKQKREF